MAVAPPDPTTPEAARVVETHVSVLCFVGDRVYKLRKPVRFGALDFGSAAARRADCHREVELNSRLAPDVYLGVADFVLDGTAIDHATVMRRLPSDRSLAALARQGRELTDELREVARTLAEFHAGAGRGPQISAAGTPEALRGVWETNWSVTDQFVGTLLDAEVEGALRRDVLAWLAGRGRLLAARVEAGAVCDGHGDLLADDVFCLDDGVRVLDCLEFDDQLRFVDVVADVAFLAMDLERLGRPDAARRFLALYEDVSGDRPTPSLVHYYLGARAYVRTLVSCLRAAQGVPDAGADASALQMIARDHLREAQVRLVLVGGVPGSGKSTLALELAGGPGRCLFRSDRIRAELAPVSSRTPEGTSERYGPAVTDAVYAELFRRAGPRLESGETVFLDASWSNGHRRAAARELAAATSSELVELRCTAAAGVADERIRRRLARGGDPSEATPEVREAMAASFEPWPSAAVVDTTDGAPEDAVLRAEAAIRRVSATDRSVAPGNRE